MPTTTSTATRRVVICHDAVEWCYSNPNVGPVITSPPDADEVGQLPTSQWRLWFRSAVTACFFAAGDHPALFYVTDRRHDGALISKAQLVFDVARTYRRRIMWHKIALRVPPGAVDVRRPGYSHLICVGGDKVRPGTATPDVFPRGPVIYPNGMGVNAARVAVGYTKPYRRGSSPIVNPFCGRGTVLAAAAEVGVPSIGIDNDPSQCIAAKTATLPNRKEVNR